MNRKRFTLVVLLAIFSAIPSARADQASLTDPQEGGSQRIWDIESITHSHVRSGQTALLRHTVRFYGDVRGTDFDRGFMGSGIHLHFEFNRNKPGPERTARFARNADDSLYVEVVGRGGKVRGFANWFHVSDKEIAIEFPKALLRPGLESYKWKTSAISGPPCEDTDAPADGCPDQTRWLKHRRP